MHLALASPSPARKRAPSSPQPRKRALCTHKFQLKGAIATSGGVAGARGGGRPKLWSD